MAIGGCAKAGCGICLGVICCCCCSCVIVSIIVGGLVHLFGSGSAEVGKCINETIKIQSKNFTTFDHCHEQCEDHFNPSYCKQEEMKCQCDITQHLSKLKHPTFRDGLSKCCVKLENWSKTIEQKVPGLNITQVYNEVFHSSGSLVQNCQDIVENTTDGLMKFAADCKKGNMVNTTSPIIPFDTIEEFDESLFHLQMRQYFHYKQLIAPGLLVAAFAAFAVARLRKTHRDMDGAATEDMAESGME